MPVTSETISLAGSGLIFNNTYDAAVTDGYRASIVTAENYLQSHFSDAVTINARFGVAALDPAKAVAANDFYVIDIDYTQLSTVLRLHATTSDDQLAVNGLPLLDPSAGAGFEIPVSEGRALGFGISPSPYDVRVELSSNEVWSYGQDAVGAIIHELTEGAFGRIGSLGLVDTRWNAMDLFRFTAGGLRDYTGGSDGKDTFFGLDSIHVSDLQFHNTVDSAGVNDHEDLADWDSTLNDAFGPGGPGSPADVSPTDLQVLDVLGWTPRPANTPIVSGDDFASGLNDGLALMGQVAVGGSVTGALQAPGDRDWFKVQLAPGNYVISEIGHTGGGGSLADPFLRIYGSTGELVRQADDILPGQNPDARLLIHISFGDTYYVEAGAFDDAGTGSYTISVAQGAAEASGGGDLLLGDLGGATLDGGAGDDTLMGRDVQNYLRGGDGNDVLWGGAAFDDMNGNKGDDTLHGGEGDDWVVGGQGNDSLSGDDGNDIVYGNLGNDTCDGGYGNDLIRGGQGDDSLSGGPGDDWISGDRGNDTMAGGAGADTFHTFSGAGMDVVLDFNAAEGDRVQVDAGTSYTLRQSGADTIVDMGNGDELILKNVQLASLPSTWIFTI